ncbi:GNAT family N-acetyltransferase [Actinokineospora inagensis]|uniref:GNAT family N-acetyltransferase n=1 Tax=Actinokineospora inagensis TaxID=103730 RepID=UPI000408F9FC|nr:GNAT family N-acetyltransferase [Actinokineospora inagensis]
MIEVREATPADGTVIGEIHAASWQAAYAPFFDAEFATREVASRRTRWHPRVGTGHLLLAAVDTRPLAFTYAVPSETRPGSAEIYSFYAHPAAWGSGVAKVLMDGLLATLRADKYSHVHLWTLRDTPQSLRFYTKCGFTKTGATHPRDFGDGNPLPQIEFERPTNNQDTTAPTPQHNRL